MANLSEKMLEVILKGNIQIPMFAERIILLRELGCIIKNKFNGQFSSVIEKGDYDAILIQKAFYENRSWL